MALELVKDTTEKAYTIRNPDGDLSVLRAKLFAEKVLNKRYGNNAADWFYAGHQQVNYDTVKIIFVEDF